MGFDYSVAELKPGKTIPVVLDMLPGAPVIELEYLGETNVSYLNDQISQANAKLMSAGGTKNKQLTKKRIDENRAKRREILAKHAVRDLKAKHKDGMPATKADIPEFCNAIPADVVDTIWAMANNEELFRGEDSPSSASDVAEKS